MFEQEFGIISIPFDGTVQGIFRANKIFWRTIFSWDKIHINWTDEVIQEIDIDILKNLLYFDLKFS